MSATAPVVVAVFCGGTSSEREVSLGSGHACALALARSFPVRLFELATDALPTEIDAASHVGVFHLARWFRGRWRHAAPARCRRDCVRGLRRGELRADDRQNAHKADRGPRGGQRGRRHPIYGANETDGRGDRVAAGRATCRQTQRSGQQRRSDDRGKSRATDFRSRRHNEWQLARRTADFRPGAFGWCARRARYGRRGDFPEVRRLRLFE